MILLQLFCNTGGRHNYFTRVGIFGGYHGEGCPTAYMPKRDGDKGEEERERSRESFELREGRERQREREMGGAQFFFYRWRKR